MGNSWKSNTDENQNTTPNMNDSCAVCSQEFPTGDDSPAIIQCDACPSKYHFNCWKDLLDRSEMCVGCNQLVSLDNSTTNVEIRMGHEDLTPSLHSIKIVDDFLDLLQEIFPTPKKCCCYFSLKWAALILCISGLLSLLNSILFFRKIKTLLENADGHNYKSILYIGVSVQFTGIIYGIIAIISIFTIITQSPKRVKYIGYLVLVSIMSAICYLVFTIAQLVYVFKTYMDVFGQHHILHTMVAGNAFNLIFNGIMTFHFAICLVAYRQECRNTFMLGISTAKQSDW